MVSIWCRLNWTQCIFTGIGHKRRTASGAVVAYVPGSGVYYSPANGNYPIYGNALNSRGVGDSSILGVDNSYETRTTNGYTNGNIDNSFGTVFAGNPSISSNRGSYSPVPWQPEYLYRSDIQNPDLISRNVGNGVAVAVNANKPAAGSSPALYESRNPILGLGSGNVNVPYPWERVVGRPNISNVGGSYNPGVVGTNVPGNSNYENAYATGLNYRTAESLSFSGNGGSYSPQTAGAYGPGIGNYGYGNAGIPLTSNTGTSGVRDSYYPGAVSTYVPGNANYGNAYGTGVNYRTAESSPISGNGRSYSPQTGEKRVSGTYDAAAESANKPGAASVSAGAYNDVASVAKNALLSAHNSEAGDPIAHVPGSVLGLYLSDDSAGTNTGYSPGNLEVTRSYYL
ncbi:interleukin enhancer-binding factor 3-like [Chrysoperla carnea]|uniref:interleukin enhancer-binding factor 3-like n=1 Tax=Chrysoperla carnea TaxID=189513 RepID=UPI001D0663D0|nr:interleukin enhancer-binding factor 3-like [Chrysoperla carnea]